MKLNLKNKIFISSLASITLALGFLGCGDSDNGNSSSNSNNSSNSTDTNNNGNQQQPGQAAGSQVDRLARPAINEGLSINDGTLNAFNSIPPSQDLSDAAKPVRDEDTNTLKAFAALGQSLGLPPAPAPEIIAGAFFPDVMRIDTRLSIPPSVTAYNASKSPTLGILTGGRKLEDDTIDITLSLLVAGDATGDLVKDGVSFAGVAGNPNQPGRQLLNGQSTRLGPATFPFVTTPN